MEYMQLYFNPPHFVSIEYLWNYIKVGLETSY